MSVKIEIELDEARRVLDLLEKVNDLFHQPMKFKDTAQVESFANENYQEIKSLYYDVAWDWMPEDVKEDIQNQ